MKIQPKKDKMSAEKMGKLEGKTAHEMET